jgi:hypothetical protein
LAAVLLLCDSLAPQLTPLSLFGAAHFSTLRRNLAVRQRGSCDAYVLSRDSIQPSDSEYVEADLSSTGAALARRQLQRDQERPQ